MKKTKPLPFADKNFPLLVHAESVSTVNDPAEMLEAIHEAIEIKYFYEGESTLLIGNRRITVTAGDVIVINPYELHSTIDYGGENVGKYHCIMVGLDFFDGVRCADLNLRHLIFGRKTCFRTKLTNTAAIATVIENIVRESKKDDTYSRLALFGYMSELFAELLRHGIDPESETPSQDSIRNYAIIEPAVRIIRDNYSEPFTVEMLAERCNVSRFHFTRIFKSVMNESPVRYIISYRLTVADTLLSNTDHRIGEIAMLTGFSDVAYFSRMYKRYFGHSPSDKISAGKLSTSSKKSLKSRTDK